MDFRQWIENKYLQWQSNQGGRRTVMQFAEYLQLSQQTVSNWLNGTRQPTGENIRKIAEKLGLEVYDVLGLQRPNPVLHYITKHWDDLPLELQNKFMEEAEAYITHETNKGKVGKKPRNA